MTTSGWSSLSGDGRRRLRRRVAVRTVDVVAWSVFSSQPVTRDELQLLMQEFGARPTVLSMGDQPEPGSWSVAASNRELVVSEATGDLGAMPPSMLEEATRLLGTVPVYCLSIFAAAGRSTGPVLRAEDDNETAVLVQRIVNAFGARWPAVLSDNTANPMTPLGALAKDQPERRRETKRGWRRFLGR